MRTIYRLTFCFLVTALSIQAFPPAPYYTLYGVVRDQVGQTLTAEGAELVLLKEGAEIGRTPINSTLQVDQNYELNIRMDHSRSGTALYSENAVDANGQFSLVVEMNGSLFYPIEVSGNLTAGRGGERIRLDLNLGEDSDGDGLPDVWEQWQLYQAGHFPDENGWDLSLIDYNGDFDQDGQPNYVEYIAGTFAGDATERFELSIKEVLDTSARCEFYAITGKSYTIDRSSDLENWSRVDFSVEALSAGQGSYTATNVGIVSVFILSDTSANDNEFYRLNVR